MLSLEDELSVLDLRYADLLQSVQKLSGCDEEDAEVGCTAMQCYCTMHALPSAEFVLLPRIISRRLYFESMLSVSLQDRKGCEAFGEVTSTTTFSSACIAPVTLQPCEVMCISNPAILVQHAQRQQQQT